MAFQDAAKKAKPVLLEPVMRVEVVVPKEHMGDVMGNLSSRRGQIQSQEDRGGTQIINARVPLSEMFGYATDLRSRTQGRATYSMHFDRYEPAPEQRERGSRGAGAGEIGSCRFMRFMGWVRGSVVRRASRTNQEPNAEPGR